MLDQLFCLRALLAQTVFLRRVEAPQATTEQAPIRQVSQEDTATQLAHLRGFEYYQPLLH